eukprot:scaffold23003_cov37-Attheya_sp.AAC.1
MCTVHWAAAVGCVSFTFCWVREPSGEQRSPSEFTFIWFLFCSVPLRVSANGVHRWVGTSSLLSIVWLRSVQCAIVAAADSFAGGNG